MSIIQINGADIPAPLPFTVTISDQDLNSDTDANAELHRNRVAVKRKIDLEWGALEWNEISTLLKAIKDVFFKVTYPDPETGKYETKTMYVGDRTAPTCVVEDGEIYWLGLKANLVEK